jgi:pimeloyl-ACP methyl ester carboxylesterase
MMGGMRCCFLRCLLIASAIATAAGCGSTPPRVHPGIQHYTIVVDGDGVGVDPTFSTRHPNSRDAAQVKSRQRGWTYSSQLREVFAAMDEFHRDHLGPPGTPRKILIFVHGGLNEPVGSLDGAEADFNDIKRSNLGYYPIFINWDSGLTSSYGEHLFDVRQGRKDDKNLFVGAAAAPLELIADLGRAVARAPLVWLYQIERDVETSNGVQAVTNKDPRKQLWVDHPRLAETVELFQALLKRYRADPKNQINISIGEEEVDRSEVAARFASYFLTLPLKLATSPLIDGGGTPAWDNMSRRALMMFEGPTLDRPTTRPAETRKPVDVLEHRSGAVQNFAERLQGYLQSHADKDHPYEITLIGHSMGTMVLNEFVRRNPSLPYKDIVYMGAACSVREFSRCVVPVLMQPGRDVRFYNLCLHPLAELRETNAADLPPRGSLLVWIDDFFGNPATPLDRTLGRWENVLQSTYVIPAKARGRVSIKAFDLRKTGEAGRVLKKVGRLRDMDWEPQKHVEFRGAVRYWEPAFWKPDAPTAVVEENVNRKVEEIQRKRRDRAGTTRPTTRDYDGDLN